MSRLFTVLLVSLSLCLTLPAFTSISAVGQSGIAFAVNLDFSDDSVAAFNQRLGQPVSAYGRFVTFPLDQLEIDGLQTFMDEVAAVGGMAVLTVEPSISLDQVSEVEATNLAQRMALFNAEGVPVLLRFAPEMNGNWHAWGQQPDAYIEAFRLVADAVHTFAPDTSMLWSPNYGSGYPFGGATATPMATALDTDGDGALAVGDDPYAPYYPGDAYVDWVGLTLFYWGNSYPWGENEVPNPDTFVNQLRGYGDTGVPDFYDTYVTGTGKPFAVFTAALVNPEAPGSDDAVAIKQAWWNQVLLAGRDQLPGLQLVEWLEWTRPEPEAGNASIDWSLTGDETVRDAFLADLPELPVRMPPPLSPSTPVAGRDGEEVG
jgi:hypothetical protein